MTPASEASQNTPDPQQDPLLLLKNLLKEGKQLPLEACAYAQAQLKRGSVFLEEAILKILTVFLFFIFLLLAGVMALGFLLWGGILAWSQLFPERPWLGFIAGGASYLALLLLFLKLYAFKQRRQRLHQEIEAYAQRTQNQSPSHQARMAESFSA